MQLLNEEKKMLKDMSAEEIKAIVMALDEDSSQLQYWDKIDCMWIEKKGTLLGAEGIHRIKPKQKRQLPIPWQFVKPEFEWAAMDEDRRIYVFTAEPFIDGDGWYHESYEAIAALTIDTTNINWKESLTQRPEGE